MKAILACDVNGGIGYQNKLPWDKIQGDLPRFKKLTDGGVVVMGRNTWDSLPMKPLPNRINFIVTSQNSLFPKSCFTIPSLEHISNFKNAWLIGGAKLINSSWNLIHEVYLSRTYSQYTCDTHIDLVQLEKDFRCVSLETCIDHTFEIWRRHEDLPRTV